jgi:hypothetical protein
MADINDDVVTGRWVSGSQNMSATSVLEKPKGVSGVS